MNLIFLFIGLGLLVFGAELIIRGSISFGKKLKVSLFAIGVVIKGETDHYEYISSAVSNGLITLSLNKDVYISNCILNVKNYNQAVERSKTKGVEAIEALLNILNND